MEATAVSLARSVLDGVLSGAGSAIADEAALLLGLRREVEFIRNELEMMRSCLKVASAKHDADDIVKTWGKQVRELAYDVEDCLLDFALYASSPGLGAWLPEHLNLARRHRVAARIRELNASVKELNQRFKRYSIVVNHPRGGDGGGDDQQQQGVLPDHDAYSPELAPPESDLEIREKDKKDLTQLISGNGKWCIHNLINGLIWTMEMLNPRVSPPDVSSGSAPAPVGNGGKLPGVVAVWGMGGMGKSFLMRTVYSNPVFLDAFDCGAWVTVPHPLDSKEEFARRLRKHLSVALEPTVEVRDYLQEKRYVIIVDDLNDQQEWGYIWEILQFGGKKGSRVVVTTRREDVARHCAGHVPQGHGYVYQLKPLGERDSMRLFCQKVYKLPNYTLEKEMKAQADNILKRCRGLPLAISTIGGLLANRPKTTLEWENMHAYIGAELESDLHNITRVIVSSYDGLPYHLKSIFLYLSIFPENHEIRCTRLLRRWMAEGYIAKNRDMPVEDVGERFYNELMSRSMIQPCKKKNSPFVNGARCRVHSMVLQIILSKFMEENQLFLVKKHCNEIPESKVRHLVVSGWKRRDDKLESINFSYVRSLTVFKECPASLISPRLRLLRVLDLEDTLNLKNEDLRHVGELYHLRYLCLRGTEVSKLPSLQNLRYLETLDIQDTLMTQLPDGIARLEKLRYLLAGVNFSKELLCGPAKEKKELCKVTESEMDNCKARQLGKMIACLCCNGSDCFRVSGLDRLCVRAPEGLEKLRDLHMLGVINVGQGNGVARKLKKLTNLRRLGVTCVTEEGQELCKSIAKLSHLQRLEVRSDSLDFLVKPKDFEPPKHLISISLYGNLLKLPMWIDSLQYLAKLKLLGTQLDQGDMLRLGGLRRLALLGLWENSYEGTSLHFGVGTFRKLMFLDIDGLKKIETVKIDKGAMLELEQLWVNNCKALQDSGHGLSGVPHLLKLNELSLKKCGEKENLMAILQKHVSEHPKRPKFLIGKSTTGLKMTASQQQTINEDGS
ncbi:hypothetical protein ABZP36_035251 [Zizania latifolia]